MIDKKIFQTITERLVQIEAEHDVRILYAIESGSRAWGFESTDSDYDVRFIYKHKTDWYLNILPKRDVIEYPIIDLLDYSGWDLRKSLFLLNKSNPVLFEWLRSPIIYRKDEHSFQKLTELARAYFSPISTVYHYLHMAEKNYKEYLKADQVKIKKYFYVLRPLLACAWVEKNETFPPMEFQNLLDDASPASEIKGPIEKLLERKKAGTELGLEPKVTVLNDYIEDLISHFNEKVQSFNPNDKPDSTLLDKVFVDILKY